LFKLKRSAEASAECEQSVVATTTWVEGRCEMVNWRQKWAHNYWQLS